MSKRYGTDELYGVVCWWEWAAGAGGWRLANSFGVNEKDWNLPAVRGQPRTHGGEWCADDGGGPPGRATTRWSMSRGVYLDCFTPPGPATWVADTAMFWGNHWQYTLVGYKELLDGTAREASAIFTRFVVARALAPAGLPPPGSAG